MEFLRRGNQASLFTTSGAAARHFRYEPAGNIGINIGVAALMADIPFSGCTESFFRILHGQGGDAVEFYPESQVVIVLHSETEAVPKSGAGEVEGAAHDLYDRVADNGSPRLTILSPRD